MSGLEKLLAWLCVLEGILLVLSMSTGFYMWREAAREGQKQTAELLDRLMSRNYSEYIHSAVVKQREPRKFKVLNDEEMAQREKDDLAAAEAARG